MTRTRALIAATALGLCLACTPSGDGTKAAPSKVPEREKSSALFRGFSADAFHRGDLVWVVHAERARVDHEGRKAHAEVVTLVYYSGGSVVSRARADRADIDMKTYNIEADGSVEVRSRNDIVLRTPHLRWDNKGQRISSASKVLVLRGRTQLTGRGFTGDRDLHDVRILSDVQAEAVSVDALREDLKTWPKR
jgi:LPS export ABC transporter protein LptC